MIEVKLVTYMGSDLLVANAARKSFDADHESWSEVPRTRRGRSDRELVIDLANEHHVLPFRHPQITLDCTAPLPIARQLGKHQVGFCLSGDSEVTFVKWVNGASNGTRKVTIRRLYELWSGRGSRYHNGESGKHQVRRRRIRVLNTETGSFEVGQIVDVMSSGLKAVFRVTLADGASLKMSKDHRVLTSHGWARLEDAVGLTVTAAGIAAMSRPCQLARNGTQVGRAAWNKGLSGYKISRTVTDAEKAAVRAARSGEKSNWWRGGVTPERARITKWTLQTAPSVHARFNYTCQRCGVRGGALTAHHIVPVYADLSLARSEGNLATVCKPCHRFIHRSPEGEIEFADLMRARGQLVPSFTAERRPNPGNTLRAHYVDVVRVEAVGEEETFDISVDHPSHNFVANGFVVHNSWSEVSRRYRTTGIGFHRIQDWRAAPAEKRQGSGEVLGTEVQNELKELQTDNVDRCVRDYLRALALGATPEHARFLLPQSMDIPWTWTGSLLGWAMLVRGRTHPDVQRETREFASAVTDIIAPLFPVSWQALMEAEG